MEEEITFPFSYQDENFEARAHPLESKSGLRNYKIHFPTVLNIVEGSVEISESLYGEWEICKIFSADPIQEEFLHCLAQAFVEYVDTHQSEGLK
ncbi:MAG TPA: hypothetical protein VFE04_10550 [Puia sp.]|nr:hypothetical protein [Puia sp.]